MSVVSSIENHEQKASGIAAKPFQLTAQSSFDINLANAEPSINYLNDGDEHERKDVTQRR